MPRALSLNIPLLWVVPAALQDHLSERDLEELPSQCYCWDIETNLGGAEGLPISFRFGIKVTVMRYTNIVYVLLQGIENRSFFPNLQIQRRGRHLPKYL